MCNAHARKKTDMSKLENAKKVVEFAKANGFPNAKSYFYSQEDEASYDETEDAVDQLSNGETDDFELCIHLSDVTLKQQISEEDGDKYSNGVEVP